MSQNFVPRLSHKNSPNFENAYYCVISVRTFSNLPSHERYFKIKQTFTVNDVDISLDSVYLRLISKYFGDSKGSIGEFL